MWHDKILRQFALVPPNPQETDFHGAYNKLLSFCVPPDSDYSIHPRYQKTGSKELTDYVSSFEVFLEKGPLFILQLKPPSGVKFPSVRKEAHEQMRERLGDLVEECPLQTIHGVSAFGTKLCFYTVDKTTMIITPHGIACHPTEVNDMAPASRWNTDILEPQGETRLKAIFQEIFDGCAGISAVARN